MANEENQSWNYFLRIGSLIASRLKNKRRFLVSLSTKFVNSVREFTKTKQLLRVEDDDTITTCHNEYNRVTSFVLKHLLFISMPLTEYTNSG